MTQYYTWENSGSGQFATCIICKKDPIKDGDEIYDGCMGKLPDPKVMSACCGHGRVGSAYVQFDHANFKEDKNGNRIAGQEALDYIAANK